MRDMNAGAMQSAASDMSALVELLEWDTGFFGFPVAQIRSARMDSAGMREIVGWCGAAGIRLLQFKCDAHSRESIAAAETGGFHFADARLTLSRRLDDPLPAREDNGFAGRMACPDDIDALHSFVDGIFIQSRYFFDTNFDRDKIHAFYCDWVSKAVTGEFDDWAWCQHDGGRPVAFCTVRECNLERPRIGLVGVAPEAQGKAVGQSMLADVLNILRERGHQRIDVVTQGRNYPAQRLYQRAGFLTETLEIYYHKWFGEAGT